MIDINIDMTVCSGAGCSLRNGCKRYKAFEQARQDQEFYVSQFDAPPFSHDKHDAIYCEYFVSIPRPKEKVNNEMVDEIIKQIHEKLADNCTPHGIVMSFEDYEELCKSVAVPGETADITHFRGLKIIRTKDIESGKWFLV